MSGYREDSFDPNAGEPEVQQPNGLRWKSLVGTLAYIGALFWLKNLTGYPDSFGVHETCTGKGCIFDDWYYSYLFMERHRPLDVLVFVYMWAPLAALIAWFVLPRFRGANSSSAKKDERPARVNVSTPSVFADENAASRRNILIAVAMSLAIGAALIAILYFKGA
jgi:hypothetical protein